MSTRAANAMAQWGQTRAVEQREPSPPQVASETPVADDLSLMDRWSASTAARGSSLADTMANVTGLEQEQQEILKGSPLSVEEAHKVSPSPAQAVWQIGSDVAGLGFDYLADTVVEGVTEGFQLLPNAVEGYTKEQFGALVESPVGQGGLAAWQRGTDAWDAFAAKYPQEARTLSKGLDLTAAGKVNQKVKFPIELTPLRADKVGNRNILAAPKGKDKDVYNIVTPDLTKQQQIDKIKRGEVSDPTGLGRNQNAIPSQEEWAVVDAVGKLKVNGAQTMQTNSNVILNEVNRLADITINKTKAVKGGADYDQVMATIRENIRKVAADNPAVFGKNGKKSQKIVDDVVAQFEKFMDESGNNSFEGLLAARQQLDNYLINEIKLGTFGNARKASVASSAHRAIRDTVNGVVEQGVPGTKDLLREQSLLLRGLEGVAGKAADESQGALGRLLQRINMHNPTTPLAQMSTLMSPLVWAGAVAVSPFVLAGQAARQLKRSNLVTRGMGNVQYGIRDVIQESTKALKMIKDPDVRKQIQSDIKVMATLLHTLPNGGEEEPVQ